MGASGHNAAKTVLADTGGAAPAPANGHHPKGRTLIHRVMATDAGRKAGYALARQKIFRPVAKYAARRKGS
jgi:hypothetical protein